MHAEHAKQAGRQPNKHCRIYQVMQGTAGQHAGYVARCKNSKLEYRSVRPSPPCTAAIYRENNMHACRTCKTGRQAAKQALPDLPSHARYCRAACRICKIAAVQHLTYLLARCKNSKLEYRSVRPSPPCTAAIYRLQITYYKVAPQRGRP